MEEEAPGSEEILRLYEARRAARAAAAERVQRSAEDTSPTGATPTTQHGDGRPALDSAASEAGAPPAVEAQPVPPLPPGPLAPPPVDAHAAGGQGAAQSQGPSTALEVRGTRAGDTLAIRAAVEGRVALSAASPALNLSDRLLEDRFVTARGSRAGVATGAVLAFVGLALVAADQALLSRGTVVTPLQTDLSSAGFVLAVLGGALALLFLVVPRRRNLRVRLAATQREEWLRVQAEAALLRRRAVLGAAGAFAGLVGAVLAYVFFFQPLAGYLASAFVLAAAVGLAVALWTAARRSVVQRLYVQTLVLQRLEQTGLGPAAQPDPRIAPVLRSLDQLLGALPESAVRRFLASDEAGQYLDLIDELRGDPARPAGRDGTDGR